MKKVFRSANFFTAIIIASLTFANTKANAQACCVNAGFGNADFTNWTLTAGSDFATVLTTCATIPSCLPGFTTFGPSVNIGPMNTIPVPPENDESFQFWINNNPTLLDGWCFISPGVPDPAMTMVSPYGSGISARIGNETNGAFAERMEFSLLVDSCNTNFTYSYAIVLNSAPHTCNQQPSFTVELLDALGVVVPGPCGSYSVASGCDPSFITSAGVSANGSPVAYKRWTNVGIDLTPYLTQTMTIRFSTYDCTQTGHFAYAYIDASCSPLEAIVAMCPGDTMQLIAAPPGYSTYQWYDTLGNPIPAPLGTNDSLFINGGSIGDQYSVVLTSLSGCSTTMIATLQISSISTTAVTTPSCFGGSNGTATESPNGGFYPYQYTWSNGQTTNPATGLAPGTYTVTIVSGGCTTIDTVTIIGSPPPPTIFTTALFCPGNPAYCVATPGYPTNQWYNMPGPVIIPGATNDSLVIPAPVAGTQYLDSMVDLNGCMQTQIVTLQQTSMFLFMSGVGFNCYGDITPNASATCNASGGPGLYTYSWNTVPPQTTQTATGLPPGTYTCVVSSGGCVDSISVIITETGPPVPTLTTVPACNCDNITITAPAGYNPHQWYGPTGNPLGTSQTQAVTCATAGQVFTDTTYDATGCMAVFKDSIVAITLTSTATATPMLSCWGDNNGTATGNGVGGALPYTYSWSPGGQTSQTATGLPAGTYTVTINSGACTSTSTVAIAQPPILDTTTVVAFCPGEGDVTLFAMSGFTSWQWYVGGASFPGTIISGATNDSLVVVNPNVAGTYVVVMSGPGCDVYNTVSLTIAPPPDLPDYVIKTNVFTPDGNGMNDKFGFYFDYTATFHVDIFDRWGLKVFESDDFNSLWDGKDKSGSPVSEGVYFWITSYTSRCTPDTDPKVSKGYVHVLRK